MSVGGGVVGVSGVAVAVSVRAVCGCPSEVMVGGVCEFELFRRAHPHATTRTQRHDVAVPGPVAAVI
jgi:hypothetical protein